MKKFIQKIGGLKYFTILIAGIALRFLPIKAPNIEPVMASTMPLAKKYGRTSGFIFAFLSMFLFDIIDGEVGAWTWVTAIVYGAIGIAASYYFKNRSNRPLNYLKFSIINTLAFDTLTGLTIGPIFYGQSFMIALVGQIPFTAIHLLGNGILAVALSPAIAYWLELKPRTTLNSAKSNLLAENPS
ncbi:MAG: ECF transporter S component [Patescibacteria group bacterium]